MILHYIIKTYYTIEYRQKQKNKTYHTIGPLYNNNWWESFPPYYLPGTKKSLAKSILFVRAKNINLTNTKLFARPDINLRK